MKPVRMIGLVALAVSTGCFHLTVISGAPASNKQIDLPWQKYYLFGFIAPEEISTKEACPLGIAKWETESSFLNGLVNEITLHIYTPIHTTITCASGPVGR
jgi:Bor protein